MDLKLFTFKYNTISIFIIYGFIYFVKLLLNIDIFPDMFIFNIFGILGGYFINDLFITYYTENYYFYFQNILKYLSILFFQNIIYKILIPNYIILNLINISKIFFIIFIYFLIDVIMDVNIKDENNNKKMYIDLVKISFGFYIIKKILDKDLGNKDYIYIVLLCSAYYLFYTIMDKRVKKLSKINFFHLKSN